MPYGVSAAQGVLDGGSTSSRSGDTGKPSSTFKVPGFAGSNNGNNGNNSKASHFHGDARSTSTSFTGVMQALLKPSCGPASAAAAKPESLERPQATFRPRSALDLSGHSFSKSIKAEINRSRVAIKTGGASGSSGAGGVPRHDWWDRSGGLGMDDSLARPSSARGAAAYAADPARSSHLRVAPRAPTAVGTGGSAMQHQQRQRLQHQQQQHQQHHHQQQQQQQQQQQARSMCRPRSHGDAILDELSRAVGLQ